MINLQLFPTEINIANTFEPDAEIVLYHGDVTDLLAKIPDNSINLIVTSPPYNLGKSYETRQSVQAYLANQSNIINELVRVLSPTGSICWQVGNFVDNGEIIPLDILYYPIFKDLGLKLRNRIVWHFGHGLHASLRFSGRYETILWFSKTDEYYFNLDDVRVPAKYPGKRYYKGPKKGQISGNPQGANPTDAWEVNVLQDWETLWWDVPNVKSNHPEKTLHPCQFPVELIQRLVLALTKKGDWVFDPYAGVGSSLIAAIMHERRAMGAEKESSYVEEVKVRIKNLLDGALPLRPMGMPVFQPTGKEKISQIPEEWLIKP
ncbi:MAG: site-specific DNA-methyltransferase [Anaerolineales bacterium]